MLSDQDFKDVNTGECVFLFCNQLEWFDMFHYGYDIVKSRPATQNEIKHLLSHKVFWK